MSGNANKNIFNPTPPFFYDYAMTCQSYIQPGIIHCSDTGLQAYFARYLLKEALSVYEWTMPKTWNENYFLYILMCRGYISIIETDKYGVIPQECGLYGYNVMYQPTHCIIANPLLKGNIRPQIDKECTLIKLQPDYTGILDIVLFYSNLMACAAESTSVNLINSKFSYTFFAESKNQAETMKKLYDDFSSGHPAVVTDKNLLGDDGKPRWQLFSQNVGQNYIADKNLAVMRRIKEMFCTEIGIPNTNEDKKERMLTDEVNANNIETYSKVSLWLDEMKRSCEKARKMFGIDLSVKLRDYDDKILFPLKDSTKANQDQDRGG